MKKQDLKDRWAGQDQLTAAYILFLDDQQANNPYYHGQPLLVLLRDIRFLADLQIKSLDEAKREEQTPPKEDL